MLEAYGGDPPQGEGQRFGRLQMLQYEIAGILPVYASGGKIARAQAISPLVEAGKVYPPLPDYEPWVNDSIDECVRFPNGAHNHRIDATAQALLRWHMQQSQIVVYQFPRVQISLI